MAQQTVQVETIVLSVHTGTFTLTPVPEADEEELIESMTDEIDADAPTPVLRAPSSKEPDQRMYDSVTSITLLIPVSDFRQMAYATTACV